jgi:3-methyl-2-oxobutanoate hydroxymethyltransferase
VAIAPLGNPLGETFSDGQVLVWLDALGMADWSPNFAKHFGEVGSAMREVAAGYVAEVKGGSFPDASHTFDA